MIKLKFKYDEKWRTMARVENDLLEACGKGAYDTAEAIVRDVKSSWSSNSPSSEGHAPAIKTGNLDSAVMVDEQGRDTLGRFQNNENAKVFFVRFDTENGDDPQGRGNYALALEDENYLNRPFIEPALDRAAKLLPANIKRNF